MLGGLKNLIRRGDPEYRVWYLRACSDEGHSHSEGTGVAVRLRKKDEPGTEKTYLLTCSHVIRRWKNQHGSSTPEHLNERHDTISAWLSGWGYDPNAGVSMTPTTAILPSLDRSEDREDFYRSDIPYAGKNDWAILEFVETRYWSITERVIGHWKAPEKDDRCVIIGFPAGDQSFAGGENGRRNIVTPSRTNPGTVGEAEETFQISELDALAGRSGGGILREDGELIGIHRAGFQGARQSFGISMSHIVTRLEEQDFEFVSKADDRQRQKRLRALWLVPAVAITCLLIMGAFMLVPTIIDRISPANPQRSILAIDPESFELPEPLERDSYLNRKIDELLMDRSAGKIDYAFHAFTDHSADSPALGIYTLQSNFPDVKLDVAAAALDVKSGKESYEFSVSPLGLTDQPISLRSNESQPISPGIRIDIVIGVKLPQQVTYTADQVVNSIDFEGSQ